MFLSRDCRHTHRLRARSLSEGSKERRAAQAEYDRSRGAGLVTEAPEIPSIECRSAQAARRFTVHFWESAFLSPNSDGSWIDEVPDR